VRIFRYFACFIVLALVGCSSVTRQSKKQMILDASQEAEVEGTGTSSADIRAMAERIARGLISKEWPEHLETIKIAVLPADNQTRFGLNPHMIQDRLVLNLVKISTGTRFRFLESPAPGDYQLVTRITALSKGDSSGVNDYILYAFKLVDKQGAILWTDEYETKKQGQVGVMQR
jgi:hypothetical protein